MQRCILNIQHNSIFSNFLVKISRETNQMMAQNQNDEIDGDSNEELNDGNDVPMEPGNKTDTAILVLNTKPFAAKPMIFHLTGKFKKKLFLK